MDLQIHAGLLYGNIGFVALWLVYHFSPGSDQNVSINIRLMQFVHFVQRLNASDFGDPLIYFSHHDSDIYVFIDYYWMV